MKVTPARLDSFKLVNPDAIQMNGIISKRFSASRRNRLHHEEEYNLLWPFQEYTPVVGKDRIVDNPPHPEITRGDWQGEFLGTWMDAACKTAWYANDLELRQKIDKMLKDWLATQGKDGYLGTYHEADRWKSWDLWIQAHDIIGLLSYYWYVGNQEALTAAIRVADRVMQDFGPGKEYLHNGPHGGMASSAILEPIVWLYWETGDERYLRFGQWLVDEDWEAPGGIAIISSLLAGNGVAHTANAKAAEMLICFSGMVELYRATGDERYLKPVLIAWDDIVQKHLYITGSISTGEHFQSNFLLRNDGVFRLGETCVTMTWLYLNLNLGRLTGEARFYDIAEQTLYNHLLGAQSPDGRGWAYYMGLRDSKRFRWHTDPDCCPSRGVRALAQMPLHIVNIKDDGFVVNFYEDSKVNLHLPLGFEIKIKMETRYPFAGDVKITVSPLEPAQFKAYLRLPGWCQERKLEVNGVLQNVSPDINGYLVIDRSWKSGDILELQFEMPPNILIDKIGNNGRVAMARGPLVYAVDNHFLPDGIILDDVILFLNKKDPAREIRLVDDEMGSVHLVTQMVMVAPNKGSGGWKERERYFRLDECSGTKTPVAVRLVPFFEAGTNDSNAYKDGVSENTEAVTNITYQVWLPYQFNQID